jgi:hypothetical protein
MTDDPPITLQEACKLYPRASFKVATLRAASGRGELHIFLLGRRYHTTESAMREWVRKCQDAVRRQDCISTGSEASGLSETDRALSAQAALNQTVEKLKKSLLDTSDKNTSRRVGQTH